MKKYFLFVLCALIAASMIFSVGTPSAHAIKNFSDQFKEKYVKEDSDDPKEKAFAEAVAAAKCLVCHEGKSKKDRNVYGTALSVLLDRKEDKDNVEKIKKSLDTVAKMKSNPKDDKSLTFAEVIASGKLPAGEPK
jgi:hypothetical protein